MHSTYQHTNQHPPPIFFSLSYGRDSAIAFLLTRWAFSLERSAFRHSCCRGHEGVQTTHQNSLHRVSKK